MVKYTVCKEEKIDHNSVCKCYSVISGSSILNAEHFISVSQWEIFKRFHFKFLKVEKQKQFFKLLLLILILFLM